MSRTPTITDPTTWALDREIVLVRVLGAAREMDVRPGGRACFDRISGDGTVFTNRFDYLEVVPSES